MSHKPWTSGPSEILKHGLNLLHDGSDVNRRLAMISIDNAVELMIKTYLGLPRRVLGFAIPRKELQVFNANFPSLLDGLEKYGKPKILGINLGDIEWFHRLRNELYHQGNGLTIEQNKVEVYGEIAKLLFKNLFDVEFVPFHESRTEQLTKFLELWANILAILPDQYMVSDSLHELHKKELIDQTELNRLLELFEIRHKIVMGQAAYHALLNDLVIQDLEFLLKSIIQRMNNADKRQLFDLQMQELELRTLQKSLISQQQQLKEEMSNHKDNMDSIYGAEKEALCPLCNQYLSKEQAELALSNLQTRGSQLGNRFRSNKQELQRITDALENLGNSKG